MPAHAWKAHARPVRWAVLATLVLLSFPGSSLAARQGPNAAAAGPEHTFGLAGPTDELGLQPLGDNQPTPAPETEPDFATASASNGNVDWMGDRASALRPLMLTNLTLPGTHASGAYELTRYIDIGDMGVVLKSLIEMVPVLEPFVTRWSITQTLNITEQLEAGARYLEMPVTMSDRFWHVCHHEIGAKLMPILSEIAEFIKEHPQELLVVEFTELGNASNRDMMRLASMIDAVFGQWMIPPSMLTTSIGELMDADQRVVAVFPFPDPAATGDMHAPSVLSGEHSHTARVQSLMDTTRAELKAWASEWSLSSLLKIDWTLRPGLQELAHAALHSDPPGSLLELAQRANSKLADFAAKLAKTAHPQMGNIIMVDDFAASGVMDVVLNELDQRVRQPAPADPE